MTPAPIIKIVLPFLIDVFLIAPKLQLSGSISIALSSSNFLFTLITCF